MKAATEIRLCVGTLLALQLLTTMGAVALLERMRPAAEQILAENVYSAHAVEDMLAALSLGPDGKGDPEVFENALVRAEGNVTEERERPLLAEVRRLRQSALAGNPAVRANLVQRLQELAAVNRALMQEADDRATQLGLGGAWAIALLGIVALVLATVSVRRLRRNILEPLRQLHAVADDAKSGHTYRRYHGGGASDLIAIARVLDQLIDRTQHGAADPEERSKRAEVDRAALLSLLDARDEPTAVLRADGAVMAANAAASAAIAATPAEERSALLSEASEGAPKPPVRTATAKLGGHAWLCTLAPRSGGGPGAARS